jgi:RimJ/RimL family protein N-acetyltransferase
MARNEKLTRLIAYTLMENHYMQATCRKLGFEVKRSAAENECVIEMSL